MRCVIIANGEIENYDHLITILKSEDFLICADGGLKHLSRLKKVPNLLVGDLDSVSENDMEWIRDHHVEVVRFPKSKDESDTELAIAYALKMKPDEILLLGVTGGRLDHTMANIGLLKEIYDKGVKASIVSDYNEIFVTNKTLVLNGKIGDTVSILPISECVKGVTYQGLQYPLTDQELHFGAPRGISNVFVSEKASITVKMGYLLVMKVIE